jgi:hypothetical protein
MRRHIAAMLAREFGFTSTGSPGDALDVTAHMLRDGWMISPGHKGEHCVVLIQPTDVAAKKGVASDA